MRTAMRVSALRLEITVTVLSLLLSIGGCCALSLEGSERSIAKTSSRHATGLRGCVNGRRGEGMGLCMRLRGGEEFDIMKLDARLRDEILLDCQRRKEGKLPMFIENIGKEAGSFGSIRYADGVEAMMPPTISGGDDDEMGGEIGGQESKPELDLTEAQKEEETRKKEAKEMEEAKEWFAAIDKRYYTEDDGGERFLGHRGIWQKRHLEAHEDMESYFQAREDAQIIDQFLKSIPANLKPHSPELQKWLDDYGWNDIILRNGTRLKWDVDMVFDSEEEDNEPNGEWNWDPPIDKNVTWFNATVRGLVEQAWDLDLDAAGAAAFFRKHNATMFDLAAMHTMLPDRAIYRVRDELTAVAHGLVPESCGQEESEDWGEEGEEEGAMFDADESERKEKGAEKEEKKEKKKERQLQDITASASSLAAETSAVSAPAAAPTEAGSVEEMVDKKGAARAWEEHFVGGVKSAPQIEVGMREEAALSSAHEEMQRRVPEELIRTFTALALPPADPNRRMEVVEECFKLLMIKWNEFYHGPVYREDIVAALDKAEASFRGRHGSKAAAYFSVPRPRDYYADPADD